jgi:hypothetical protein
MAELEQERAKLASSASSSADYKNMYDNLVKQLEQLNSNIEGIPTDCPQTGGRRTRRSNKGKNRKTRKTKKIRKSRNKRLRKRSRRR